MKLAIKGGTPVRSTLFPAQNSIGPEEKAAAMRVMDTGILTGYQGNWSSNFYGGVEIRALEEEWAAKFRVKHAIACNSATSGLFIACGAVGMGYSVGGDGLGRRGGDAIVTPFSMTCSATAPMGWGTGVRFGDIERGHYCLSVDSVREHLLNAFTKFSAVIPVSLFGQPYDANAYKTMLEETRKLTGRRVYVIEDAAQAVGSTLDGRYAGTLGDIGVYSFNLGKHLTAGEGGMIVTDDDELAMRCRLIMNHAEAVINDYDKQSAPGVIPAGQVISHDMYSLFGFNLRMPEISAAIVRVQLGKMDHMIAQRVDNVDYLVNKLKDIPCLEMPAVRTGCTHSYYVLPLKYKQEEVAGQSLPAFSPHRDHFVAAVKAELKPVMGRENEGVTIGAGYIKPIQAMPLFDRSADETPECKRQWQDELIIVHRMFGPAASRRDLDDVANAFEKCWENREEIL
jgi:perosamine synthetase